MIEPVPAISPAPPAVLRDGRKGDPRVLNISTSSGCRQLRGLAGSRGYAPPIMRARNVHVRKIRIFSIGSQLRRSPRKSPQGALCI